MELLESCQSVLSDVQERLNELEIEIINSVCFVEDSDEVTIFIEGVNWHCHITVQEDNVTFDSWYLIIKPFQSIMTRDCTKWNMTTEQILERIKILRLK